jgi:hypothetical protein
MIWPSSESIQRHMGCIICFLDVLKEVVLFLPCPLRGLLDNFTFVNPCWPLKTGPPPPLGFLHISRQVSVLLECHNNTYVTQSGLTFILDFIKTLFLGCHPQLLTSRRIPQISVHCYSRQLHNNGFQVTVEPHTK